MISRIGRPWRTMLRPNRSQIILLSLALAAISLAGCSSKEPEVVPEVSVQVTPAKTGDVSRVVTAEAVVFPLQQAVVTPKISSTVKSFAVQRGAKVRKGQLLAVLENADLSAAATQSKGEYEQAEGNYVTATVSSIPEQIQKAELDASSSKAAADAAEKIAASRKELFQQGALPRRELDAAEVALAQAQSQYQQAQKLLEDLRKSGKEQALKTAGGQLNAAKGKLMGAEAALGYSMIKSPIDGIVADRPLYPGEMAAANQPLLTIINNTHLIAKAHVSQSQAVGLKKGDEAEIVIAGEEKPIPAKLSLVSPALDPGSTTIEVWVETAKPPASLRPGMTVQISITAATVEDAVVAPNNAIFQSNEGGGNYVMVAGSDNLAHQKAVQLGIRGVSETQIKSGVAAGESIITTGGYGLPDKTKIKIEAPAKDEDAGKSVEKSGKDDDKSDDKAGAPAANKSADKSAKKPAAKSQPAASEKE